MLVCQLKCCFADIPSHGDVKRARWREKTGLKWRAWQLRLTEAIRKLVLDSGLNTASRKSERRKAMQRIHAKKDEPCRREKGSFVVKGVV